MACRYASGTALRNMNMAHGRRGFIGQVAMDEGRHGSTINSCGDGARLDRLLEQHAQLQFRCGLPELDRRGDACTHAQAGMQAHAHARRHTDPQARMQARAHSHTHTRTHARTHARAHRNTRMHAFTRVSCLSGWLRAFKRLHPQAHGHPCTHAGDDGDSRLERWQSRWQTAQTGGHTAAADGAETIGIKGLGHLCIDMCMNTQGHVRIGRACVLLSSIGTYATRLQLWFSGKRRRRHSRRFSHRYNRRQRATGTVGHPQVWHACPHARMPACPHACMPACLHARMPVRRTPARCTLHAACALHAPVCVCAICTSMPCVPHGIKYDKARCILHMLACMRECTF